MHLDGFVIEQDVLHPVEAKFKQQLIIGAQLLHNLGINLVGFQKFALKNKASEHIHIGGGHEEHLLGLIGNHHAIGAAHNLPAGHFHQDFNPAAILLVIGLNALLLAKFGNLLLLVFVMALAMILLDEEEEILRTG